MPQHGQVFLSVIEIQMTVLYNWKNKCVCVRGGGSYIVLYLNTKYPKDATNVKFANMTIYGLKYEIL